MKTVILAGGEGTRLRPLTCDLPKPMARLCGRPMLQYLFELLLHHGIREATVATHYLSDQIRDGFGDAFGELALRYVEETSPLGTAGCVKNAVGDTQEEVLVVSGDALTDMDLSAAIEFHRQHRAVVTMIVTRVGDPREYGLTEFNEDGRVTGFLEKPGWAQVSTDAANTGMYILSPQAIAAIPPNQVMDFAKDLFPKLLQQGLPVYAYEADGYWCDIGDLNTYVACQQDILTGKVITDVSAQNGLCFADGRPEGDYILLPPVYIGRHVQIGRGAQIGPFAVLDDDCRVGIGARVRSSVLLPSSYVGDKASLTGTLLCHGASVCRGSSLFEGATVGAGAIIGEGTVISPEVKIWPGKRIDEHTVQRDNLRSGRCYPSRFDDDGIIGETGAEMTPELCARIGAAVGSLCHGERLAVGCSAEKSAEALKMALTAGILGTGAAVWDFGRCIEPQFDYLVNFSPIHMGVFVQSGTVSALRVVREDGLPAVRSEERAIEARLASGDFRRAGADEIQQVASLTDMSRLYRQYLLSLAPDGLSGMSADVRGTDKEAVSLLNGVLTSLGCRVGSGLRLHLSADARRLSLFDDTAGYIWPERVLALNGLLALKNGEDLALPYDAPSALDDLAASYHRSVRRYGNCPTTDEDRQARELAATQPWARDGLMMAIRLLSALRRDRTPLSSLLSELPRFSVVSKSIPCHVNPGRVLLRLRQEDRSDVCAEGTRLTLSGGKGYIRPSKLGKNLLLTVEATEAETAEELCGGLEQKLASVFLDIGEENG